MAIILEGEWNLFHLTRYGSPGRTGGANANWCFAYVTTTDFSMSSILNTFFESTELLLSKVGIIITETMMSASLILFGQESFLWHGVMILTVAWDATELRSNSKLQNYKPRVSTYFFSLRSGDFLVNDLICGPFKYWPTLIA